MALLAGAAVARYVALKADVDWHDSVYTPFFSNLDLFLTGMTTAWLVERDAGLARRLISKRTVTAAFFGIAAYYVLASYVSSITFYKYYSIGFLSLWPAVSVIFAAVTIFIFEIGGSEALSALPRLRKVVAATQIFGVLTYCIYVWHPAIMLSIRKNYPEVLETHHTVLALIPVCALIGAISAWSYWFVERPFERMKFR